MNAEAKFNSASELAPWQRAFVEQIRRIVEQNWRSRRPHIRILDNGCDTSGKQLCHLAGLTAGEVVGINNAPGFPSAAVQQNVPENVSLISMNGMELKFPDQSFDFVISANVMEHVSSPEKYIRECRRVLNNDGLAYFETYPLWTGARGHHIHTDMVAEHCPAENNYRNDGSVIPDWSHLRKNETEMRAILNDHVRPETSEYILHYLYRQDDLNRTGWNSIKSSLQNNFAEVELKTWGAERSNQTLKPQDQAEDYGVAGFSAIARKTKQNPLTKLIPGRWIARLRP